MPKVEGRCARPECGRTFLYYPSARPGICCSRSCSLKYSPRKPRLGTETLCAAGCGRTVYANAGQRAQGQGQYCSKACATVGQTKPATIKVCALEGCDKELRLKPSQVARQYCSKQHEAMGKTKRPGERIYNGKPIRYDNNGYVMVWEPEHPNKAFKGWQYEHRVVIEKRLGRHLLPTEHVHHVNHVRDDNADGNLELMGHLEHLALSSREHQEVNREVLAELKTVRDKLAEYERRFGPLP